MRSPERVQTRDTSEKMREERLNRNFAEAPCEEQSEE